VIVVAVTNRVITPPPGVSWKAFTVYAIQGNDGVKYETTDEKYALARKPSEVVKIAFYVDVSTKGDKTYTNYKIFTPKIDRQTEMLEKINARLDQMEKNIIAAIKLAGGIPTVGEVASDVADDLEEISNYEEDPENY
jgi:hypothetical protein